MSATVGYQSAARVDLQNDVADFDSDFEKTEKYLKSVIVRLYVPLAFCWVLALGLAHLMPTLTAYNDPRLHWADYEFVDVINVLAFINFACVASLFLQVGNEDLKRFFAAAVLVIVVEKCYKWFIVLTMGNAALGTLVVMKVICFLFVGCFVTCPLPNKWFERFGFKSDTKWEPCWTWVTYQGFCCQLPRLTRKWHFLVLLLCVGVDCTLLFDFLGYQRLALTASIFGYALGFAHVWWVGHDLHVAVNLSIMILFTILAHITAGAAVIASFVNVGELRMVLCLLSPVVAKAMNLPYRVTRYDINAM